MFAKLFSKKTNAVKSELKKVENRDLMQAIIGGSILVAGADGSLSEDEMISLEKSIAANPSLAHFGSEIHQELGRFKQQLDVSFRIAKLSVMKELADIANTPDEAQECFVNCIVIAEADGEICDKEMAILKEIGQALGQRLSDYGIE